MVNKENQHNIPYHLLRKKNDYCQNLNGKLIEAVFVFVLKTEKLKTVFKYSILKTLHSNKFLNFEFSKTNKQFYRMESNRP